MHLVWWEDVCEDALTSKGLNTQLRVIGGGARNATDKVRPAIHSNLHPPQTNSNRNSNRSSKTTLSVASTTSPASTQRISERSTSPAATA